MCAINAPFHIHWLIITNISFSNYSGIRISFSNIYKASTVDNNKIQDRLFLHVSISTFWISQFISQLSIILPPGLHTLFPVYGARIQTFRLWWFLHLNPQSIDLYCTGVPSSENLIYFYVFFIGIHLPSAFRLCKYLCIGSCSTHPCLRIWPRTQRIPGSSKSCSGCPSRTRLWQDDSGKRELLRPRHRFQSPSKETFYKKKKLCYLFATSSTPIRVENPGGSSDFCLRGSRLFRTNLPGGPLFWVLLHFTSKFFF